MKNDGRRLNVPPWVSDPDLVAPCLCGEEFDPDSYYIIVQDPYTNLKRWFHLTCLQDMQGFFFDIENED